MSQCDRNRCFCAGFHARGAMEVAQPMLCVSHDTALYYWRSNPPWYVLEGRDRNIRSLRDVAKTKDEFKTFFLSEMEFGPDPLDILVPINAPRCPARFRRHEQRAKLPAHALYPLHDGIHVVSPELCLVQLCQERSFAEMLEIGMEFCGTYSIGLSGDDGMRQRDYALVNASAFRKHLETWRDLSGLTLARRVARYLVDGSASPMETKLFLLLCLPQKYGGYHLPAPELNPVLALEHEGQLLLRKNSVSPDMLWREARLIVEYDGRYHLDEKQSVEDEMRKTVLEGMGYTVWRIKREQLYHPLAFDGVVCGIAKKLGKRMRPLSLSQAHARDELRGKLLRRPGARPSGTFASQEAYSE